MFNSSGRFSKLLCYSDKQHLLRDVNAYAAPSHSAVPRTHQQEAGVYEAEGSGAADACAAVHHHGTLVRVHAPGLPHLEQEVEEGGGRLRHPKVGPGGIVEMKDLS